MNAPKDLFLPQTPSFQDFLRTRERISNDYINGHPGPLKDITTQQDPATFFPPSGTTVQGAAAVSHGHSQGAASFRDGSTGQFEVMQSASSGTLAFWTGVQHAEVMMEGKDERVSMQLRTTEVFRLEDGEWKLIHRHADLRKQGDAEN
jgi:ketosteroid isomerase-like protein